MLITSMGLCNFLGVNLEKSTTWETREFQRQLATLIMATATAQFEAASPSAGLDMFEAKPDMCWTERQRRERQYYEQFSRLNTPSEVSFRPVLGGEQRPWNPYWFLCERVQSVFHSREQRLLDFGCGPGVYSVIFGRVGFEVIGLDISPSNIAIAEKLAEKYDLSETVHFGAGATEGLDYPDEYFDVVVGIDILHHVDIERSIRECLRVLKQGGVAFFKEPVAVPVFDPLRNSALGKYLVPKEASFERHITEDERKLTAGDLQMIKTLCPQVAIKRFRLFSRLDAFNKNLATNGESSTIEKFDERVFQLLPFMRAFGGDVVISLRKQGR